MKITRKHLSAAAERGILSEEQADALFDFLRAEPATGPIFDFTHILYYFGGLVAIDAMTLFMNLGWEAFGGWGIFWIALAYAGVGLWLADRFRHKGYAVPAGICATFVVALAPLAIYGLQLGLGWWPDDTVYRSYHRYIKWHWIYLELGTLAVGAIMVWRFRYPFLLMPVAVTLWYMSMDLAAMLTEGRMDWQFRAFVSMWFGAATLLLALWVDIRSFWGGLTSQHSDSEWAKLAYFGINLVLIGLGAILDRRVFVVFGGLGSAVYFGHLAANVFEDSWLFPIALTAIGLAIVYLGIVWQKHELAITRKLRSVLPPAIRELLDARP